jgi:hypothetical protein
MRNREACMKNEDESIKSILDKNNISYRQEGGEFIIVCPFCEKTIQGEPLGTLNIDRFMHSSCSACSKEAGWNELLDALSISTSTTKKELAPKEKKKGKEHKTNNFITEPEQIIPAERIKKLDRPEKEISFEEWREVIKRNFPELLFSAETGLSIISQILIKDITNPFALVLVDVPSSGKTIVVNFFADIRELAYPSDKFTPSSFLSNASNVKKSELKDFLYCET